MTLFHRTGLMKDTLSPSFDPERLRQYNSGMHRLTVFLAILLSIATFAFGQSATKRYLYLSMPDGAQKEGRSDPPRILIFDIDNRSCRTE